MGFQTYTSDDSYYSKYTYSLAIPISPSSIGNCTILSPLSRLVWSPGTSSTSTGHMDNMKYSSDLFDMLHVPFR